MPYSKCQGEQVVTPRHPMEGKVGIFIKMWGQVGLDYEHFM